MDKDRIEFENEVLNRLSGKIFLLQDLTQKRRVIFQAFSEVYNSPAQQKFIKESGAADMDTFFKEFFSYGIIDGFLADPDVEDIMINYLSPVYIHKTDTGLIKTDKRFSSWEDLDLFIRKLIVFSGRTQIKKINNVELAEIRGRVNIVYSPYGPQITITRAKEKPLSIIELIKNGTLNSQIAAQFWLYVEGLRGIKPANILVAGGPGSGKTTFLNALFNFIPGEDRIVVIEDTLELNTELEENCSHLESDEDTTLADLVKNALRMRPDRIVVGEVRGKEAQDLMTAMNIGKCCMGTLHASTARETIMRMENEPMNVPEVLLNLIDVFVIMRRYNHDGKIRRIVGELVETAGMEERKVLSSSLWTYDFSVFKYRESSVSSIYRDRLAQISGKTPKDLIQELKVRAFLIDKLVEKDIADFKASTEFFRTYVTDPDAAISSLGLSREDLPH